MATQTLKRFFLGPPIANERASEERLSKSTALAVFSSDALSSVAYATEEILLVLVLASALYLSIPIALAIVCLLAILTISYRQVISAYPSGGGSYVVASENLGHTAGLIAGSSLLVDYILTVAVSVASGVAAITSAFPTLRPYTVEFCVFFVCLVGFANLRGTKESGKLFAVPTYAFISGLAIMILVGLFKHYTGGDISPDTTPIAEGALQPLTLFLILRAFSSGCAALTGVEAISNGVQAFKKPAQKNARTTLLWMACILGLLFLGITILASLAHIVPNHQETVLSQLTRGIFGPGPIYYYLQAATALILILAANTSFADFPRVASLMAADGYVPHQLQNKGDKLAYSNGIIMLSIFAILLLVVFRGSTSRLIPLYAVGVFTSFTLSQAGMVKHWFKERRSGWKKRAAINGLGGLTTFVVLLVIAATKFMHGAWVVIFLIPLIIGLFLSIKRHYINIAKQLSLRNLRPPKPIHNHVVLCVSSVHRGTLQALRYAKMIASKDEIGAIFVNTSEKEPRELLERWKKYGFKTPIQVLPSPYREVIGPIIETVEKIQKENPGDFVTIVVPEFVCKRWWEHLLHNQTAFLLKTRLVLWSNVIVTSVPYHLQ